MTTEAKPTETQIDEPTTQEQEIEKLYAAEDAQAATDAEKKPSETGDAAPEKKEEEKKETGISAEDAALVKDYGYEADKITPAELAALKKANAKVVEERGKAQHLDNEVKRWGSQNRDLSTKYQSLKKRVAEIEEAQPVSDDEIKAVREKLRPKLPTGDRLLEDDDFLRLQIAINPNLRKMGQKEEGAVEPDPLETGKAEPGKTEVSPEQHEKLTSIFKKSAVKITEAHPDFVQVIASPDYIKYMDDRINQERNVAVEMGADPNAAIRDLSPTAAKLMNPNPVGHIELLNEFKGSRKAMADAQAAEEAKKNKAAAFSGVGESKQTRTGQKAKSFDELSPDEITALSDEEFEALRKARN